MLYIYNMWHLKG